jgi:hypothetical protein
VARGIEEWDTARPQPVTKCCEKCECPIYARGLCRSHYMRSRRAKPVPRTMPPKPAAAGKEFLSNGISGLSEVAGQRGSPEEFLGQQSWVSTPVDLRVGEVVTVSYWHPLAEFEETITGTVLSLDYHGSVLMKSPEGRSSCLYREHIHAPETPSARSVRSPSSVPTAPSTAPLGARGALRGSVAKRVNP